MATLALTALTAIKGAGLSTILSAAGTAVGAVGAIQGGKAQQASANYQAAQLEAAGKTERAIAQREAEEDRRQARLMQSRARAVGAASGGGIDLELAGDIAEEGEYRALTSIWEGEEAAKGRNAQAAAARFEGKQAKKAGYLRGASKAFSGAASLSDNLAPSKTILSNGQSLMEKYG